MSLGKTCRVALFLSAAMLVTSVAQAMEIQQFDKMADQDQADYIGDLIVGAENVLTDEGKHDLAMRVRQLFTTREPGDSDTAGMTAFEINLARVRVVDAKNAETNSNAPRLEVEHAMILTLRDNGIALPKTIMTVMNNFKPKFPPRKD